MINSLIQILNIFKFRISVAITLCAMAGMAVTPGQSLPIWKIFVLASAVFLSSASAGAFNHYVERELDAQMPRTAKRPFATGFFKPGWQWVFVIGLIFAIAIGLSAWILNVQVAIYNFLGAFVYGVVYTIWLKQRSAWNIVIGGLAGSFAVLAGAAAITTNLPVPTIILAIILFLWTPPHFWSLAIVLHREYEAAGVPMLPVIIGDAASAKFILAHTILLVLVSLLLFKFGLGIIYLAGALIGGGYFLQRSIALVRDPSRENAMSNFRASFVQLGLVLVTAILDFGINL